MVVVAAALTGARAWLDSRWYVGVAGDHVAIFQGIPVTVLGFRLSHLDLQTPVDATEAEAVPSGFWDSLGDGMNVESREAALDTDRGRSRATSRRRVRRRSRGRDAVSVPTRSRRGGGRACSCSWSV